MSTKDSTPLPVEKSLSGVRNRSWGSTLFLWYFLIKAGVSSLELMSNSSAYLRQSQSNAFKGTNTMIHLRSRWDAGYWKSKLFPKPVGKLTSTLEPLLQLIMAICIGFNRIPLRKSSSPGLVQSLTFPTLIRANNKKQNSCQIISVRLGEFCLVFLFFTSFMQVEGLISAVSNSLFVRIDQAVDWQAQKIVWN